MMTHQIIEQLPKNKIIISKRVEKVSPNNLMKIKIKRN